MCLNVRTLDVYFMQDHPLAPLPTKYLLSVQKICICHVNEVEEVAGAIEVCGTEYFNLSNARKPAVVS